MERLVLCAVEVYESDFRWSMSESSVIWNSRLLSKTDQRQGKAGTRARQSHVRGILPGCLQCLIRWGVISNWCTKGLSGISPTTAVPASAARIAEDGVMVGGRELEQAVLSFADRGIGDRNLATLLRLDSGFNEESLGWFDIIDRRRDGSWEGRWSACCLRCRFGMTSKQKSCVSTSPT